MVSSKRFEIVLLLGVGCMRDHQGMRLDENKFE